MAAVKAILAGKGRHCSELPCESVSYLKEVLRENAKVINIPPPTVTEHMPFIPMVMDGGKVALPREGRLENILRKLESVEHHLHLDKTEAPTVAENRFYRLILRHVRFYILLFYVEKGLCEPGTLIMQKLVEAKETVEETNDISCLSGESVNNAISETWGQGTPLTVLLKKTRKRLSKLPANQSKKTRKKPFLLSIPAQQLQKTWRETPLLDILQGLEDLGRSRLYSPPNGSEIPLYQEIRKRVTSCVDYIEARPIWQCRLRKWQMIAEEDQLDSMAKCEEIWDEFRRESGDTIPFSCAPTGYKLSAALDELPGFLSLAKECSDQFADICTRLYEKKGVGEVSDGARMERVGEEEGQISKLELKVSKLKLKQIRGVGEVSDGAPMERGGEEVHRVSKLKLKQIRGLEKKKHGPSSDGKKTREHYLQHILMVLKKMGPLLWKSQLEVPELRLYLQIWEHVTASLWMYGGRIKSARVEKKYDLVEGDSSDAGYCLSDGETKSLEQYLWEILLSVKAIKSSFLATPPSFPEAVLYNDILENMSQELLNPKSFCQEQVEAKNRGDFGELKPLLGIIYDWERGVFKEVKGAYEKMVRKTFPNEFADPAVDPLKWVDTCFYDSKLRTKVSTELEPIFALPGGLALLDRLIVISLKIDSMFDVISFGMGDANNYMDYLLQNEKFEVAAQEVSSALEVLKFHNS